MTFTLLFGIWMLAAYLDTIPRDLDDAAKVDGSGPMGAFIRVVIPAAVPGIVAVLIYAFMTSWSEMLFASVLTNDSTRTLAVGLQGYATQNQVYWPGLTGGHDQQRRVGILGQHHGVGDRQHRGTVDEHQVEEPAQGREDLLHPHPVQQLGGIGRRLPAGQQPEVVVPRDGLDEFLHPPLAEDPRGQPPPFLHPPQTP